MFCRCMIICALGRARFSFLGNDLFEAKPTDLEKLREAKEQVEQIFSEYEGFSPVEKNLQPLLNIRVLDHLAYIRETENNHFKVSYSSSDIFVPSCTKALSMGLDPPTGIFDHWEQRGMDL